jgi:hypothetical protein
MAFSVTSTSLTSDPVAYSAEVNKNFADVAKELNAITTAGAWKSGAVITTTHIADGSLGGQVFVDPLVFAQVPRGPLGTDPSHSDHFVPKRFIDNLKAALLLPSSASMNSGENRLDTEIAEYDEIFTFGNGMMIEVGCKLCSTQEAASQTIDVDLVAGFNKIIFPFGTLLRKSSPPANSGSLGAPTGSNATAHVTIGARSKITFSLSNAPQSDYYGVLYFIVGCA